MGKYNTKQRDMLIDFLRQNIDKNLSAREIHAGITDSAISLSAVYRNLIELEAEGKVHKVKKGNLRDVSYRYTDENTCRNFIHLSCENCGRTIHLNSDTSEQIITNIEKAKNFSIDSLKTVIYGICEDCKKKIS